MKVYVFQSDKRSLDIPGDPPLRIENYIISTTDEQVAARARRQNSLYEITDFEVKEEPPVEAPKEAPKVEQPKPQGHFKKKIGRPPAVQMVVGMRTVKEKE